MKIRAPLGIGLIMLLASACGPSSNLPPAIHLTVEEHPLREAPSLEPLSFSPVESTMQAVLVLHAVERTKIIPDDSILLNGQHAIRRTLGSDELIATEDGGGSNSTNSVAVTRNGTEIYSVPAGVPSPLSGLQGFWTYQDRYWALETTYVAPETLAGLIAINGVQLVPGNGYDEGFALQILADRPFYFARRGDKIGYFFGEAFTDAGYSEISHYQCCSAAAINPLHAENMIAFFARRGAIWYYVEISVLDNVPK